MTRSTSTATFTAPSLSGRRFREEKYQALGHSASLFRGILGDSKWMILKGPEKRQSGSVVPWSACAGIVDLIFSTRDQIAQRRLSLSVVNLLRSHCKSLPAAHKDA